MTILRTLQWLAAPCALALLLAGCSSQELYSQLSERQANEMVALLRNAGLAAEKKSHEGQFSVVTSGRDFPAAVRTLSAQGYPREQFDSMGKIFRREGFVSSPLEERARLVHALSQEISSTVASIDGVVTARVHLVVPERNPLSDKLQPAAAAVFIKHRPDKDLAAQTAQIKALVVNSIEGLPYDNVTVALFPAESWPGEGAPPAAATATQTQPQRRPSLDLPLTAGAAAGTLALGGGGMLWWRRRSAARDEATVMQQRPTAGPPPMPRGGLPDELQAALRRAAGQR